MTNASYTPLELVYKRIYQLKINLHLHLGHSGSLFLRRLVAVLGALL